MQIYDKTTLAFAAKGESMVRDILVKAGLTVGKTRFAWKGLRYPINVVVFEGRELGHFNAPYYQIGLNRKLIYQAKDSVVRDILKHEVAHYLTYLKFGNVQSHGAEFRSVCEEYGFTDEVALATINLDEANLAKEGDLASERVLDKVKKLLQLAQSSNAHEAEIATLKANELLLRHNIEGLAEKIETLYLDRLLLRPKKDAKLSAIYEILRHFVVKPVFSYGKNSVCLDVSGTLTNVRLARYVAEFLDRELEHLWDLTKKEYSLSGLRAKNSFFIGVANGFDLKMKHIKATFSASDQKALVLVERKLEIDTKMIYSRLSHSISTRGTDTGAHEIGITKGRDLNIRQGVETSSKNLSLSWDRQ
jgi:hypothetical protein